MSPLNNSYHLVKWSGMRCGSRMRGYPNYHLGQTAQCDIRAKSLSENQKSGSGGWYRSCNGSIRSHWYRRTHACNAIIMCHGSSGHAQNPHGSRK